MPGAARYELVVVSGGESDILLITGDTDFWPRIGGDNLTGTTYLHTGLTTGMVYIYAIRAVNASGETSAWSDLVHELT